MNTTAIQSLKAAIEPVRNRLIAHPVYRAMQRPAALRTFMQFHVYAVWDFMSLLKALQRELTCVEVPWMPRGSAGTRFLINEIVVGEESDVDEQGRRTSHFELYVRAMDQAGAHVSDISKLMVGMRAVARGSDLWKVIDANVPEESVRSFLRFTFDTIATGEVHRIAAVFTFGREDLIPDMFLKIVEDFVSDGVGDFQLFKYYLERHIEVDGDHHSHLAMEMLSELCGDDEVKWREATVAATEAIEARIGLWDGVMDAIGRID